MMRGVRRAAVAELRRVDSGDPVLAAVSQLWRTPRGTTRATRSVLEARRQQLLDSQESIRLMAEDGQRDTTTVAETTKRTSKSPEWCAFLFELAVAEKARSIVEMGTSVGVSGSYLATAAKLNGGRLVTLEGLEDSAACAQRGFDELELPAEVVVGPFSDTLEPVLDRCSPIDLMFIDGHHHEEPTLEYFEAALPRLDKGALVAFDDIRWSDGMRRAWARLESHPAVAWALDLHAIGLTRIRK